MDLGQILVVALVAVVGALVALTLASIAGRLIVISRARRRRRADLRARPGLLALLDDETPPEVAGSRQRRAASRLAVQMLPKLRGDARAPLIALLEREGVLARARRGVRAAGAVRRARAVELLGVAGVPEDVPLLLARLGDRRSEVRVVAARALGKSGDARAAEALVAALSGVRAVPLGIGTSALVALGAPAVPALRSGLGSADAATREAAAEVLGLLGDTASAPVMIRSLADDPEQAVRVATARALGRMGPPAATPALLATLAVETASPLRTAAAAALAESGVGGAAPGLVDALADPVAEVGRHAAIALAASGDEGRRLLIEVSHGGGPAASHAREALARLDLAVPVRRATTSDGAVLAPAG